MLRRPICCLLLGCALSAVQAIAAPGFQGLGDLPGGTYSSTANDISENGLVVVGDSNGATGKAGFRWTTATGMQSLPLATATITNNDGSVIAGKNIRWTSATGPVVMQGVSNIDFGANSAGMSGDGSVVVGTWDLSNTFRWVAGDGPATAVADFFEAVDVSFDGQSVLGVNLQGAAIWNSLSGVTQLGKLPNEEANFPSALSQDASVAVGFSIDSNFNWNSYRWTAQGGMVAISPLVPNSAQFVAADVSGDGSRVVGYDAGGKSQVSFLWTPNLGSLDLQKWLTDNGISIPANWKLTAATAISADGRTIVGEGKNPSGNSEGWIVQLPKPGDANSDGRVDGADYVNWADNFLKSTNLFLKGDFNSDGVVNGADYVEWADHFSPNASPSVSAVPEPSTFGMLFAGLALVVGYQQIRRFR